jgi:hypothetical protein
MLSSGVEVVVTFGETGFDGLLDGLAMMAILSSLAANIARIAIMYMLIKGTQGASCVL